MKVFNEFSYQVSESEIKKLIIQDLVAKIGWIKGNYPNKVDSTTNLDILFRHLAFEDGKDENPISSVTWDNENEIFTEIVTQFPISKYFFGKEFPKIRWFVNKDNTITYTLC